MGKRKRNKKAGKPDSLFLRVFLVVFFCAVAVGIVRQGLYYQEVQAELATVTAEIEAAQEEQQEYETKRDYYTGDAYIEQVAREQLGMVKPNEILYINRSQ